MTPLTADCTCREPEKPLVCQQSDRGRYRHFSGILLLFTSLTPAGCLTPAPETGGRKPLSATVRGCLSCHSQGGLPLARRLRQASHVIAPHGRRLRLRAPRSARWRLRGRRLQHTVEAGFRKTIGLAFAFRHERLQPVHRHVSRDLSDPRQNPRFGHACRRPGNAPRRRRSFAGRVDGPASPGAPW